MGFIIYVVLQVIAAVYAVYILTHWREIRERNKGRKDSPAQIVVLIILIPAIAYGYQSLKAHPLGPEQWTQMYWMTAAMYAVLLARWVRQNWRGRANGSKGSTESAIARETQYLYRAIDGSRCGPETESRLKMLVRMGAISGDTLVAESAPDAAEEWKPLRERFGEVK